VFVVMGWLPAFRSPGRLHFQGEVDYSVLSLTEIMYELTVYRMLKLRACFLD
jgi:hypothetical protein